MFLTAKLLSIPLGVLLYISPPALNETQRNLQHICPSLVLEEKLLSQLSRYLPYISTSARSISGSWPPSKLTGYFFTFAATEAPKLFRNLISTRETLHTGGYQTPRRGQGRESSLELSLVRFPHGQRKYPPAYAKPCPLPLLPLRYRDGPCSGAGCGYRPVISLYPCTCVSVTRTISSPPPLLILP